jgi:hypothetical protein
MPWRSLQYWDLTRNNPGSFTARLLRFPALGCYPQPFNDRASNRSDPSKACAENTVLTVLESDCPGGKVSAAGCRLGEEIMARCINENCNLPLHSLSEGRLFQFEVISISLAANDATAAPFDEKPQRETVHFWLCGSCASMWTLTLEPARGLKLLPVQGRNSTATEDFTPVRRDSVNARGC